MTTQHEALQYATALRSNSVFFTPKYMGFIADELERLHARTLELEASQAQRAPLTEDQVRKNKTIRLMNAASGLSIGMLMGLVRAIERAQDEAQGFPQEKQV